jgi:hypothetical protein
LVLSDVPEGPNVYRTSSQITLELRRSEIFGFAEKSTLRSSGAGKSFKNHKL